MEIPTETPTTKNTPTTAATTDTIPYWERLPSQSLTPAEVLTVDECIQHASLYEERRVRVTGILQERGWQEEKVLLKLQTNLPVIADPLLRHLSELTPGSMVMVMGTMVEGRLEACFVQPVAQTDLAAYQRALKIRRKRIYQLSQPVTEGLMVGCGPPPYEPLADE